MSTSIKTSQDQEEEDASFYIEPGENPISELKANESEMFKEELIQQVKQLQAQNNDQQ